MKAKEIGATLRALRTELGMTTTDLARKVGISQAQVSRLENGLQGFRSGTVVKLANVLKVPPFRLFMTEKDWANWTRRK